MIGKLLSIPVQILNAPLDALENAIEKREDDDDRIVSAPLHELAEALKDIDKD